MHVEREPKPSIGETVANIGDQIKGLVKGEIELAKAQTREKYQPYGPAIGLFAGAGVLALFGLGYLFFAIYLALSTVLEQWAAALITAGIIFLLVTSLALGGRQLIALAKKRKVTVGENIKADVAALKEGIRR